MRWLCHVKIDDQPRLNGKLRRRETSRSVGCLLAAVRIGSAALTPPEVGLAPPGPVSPGRASSSRCVCAQAKAARGCDDEAGIGEDGLGECGCLAIGDRGEQFSVGGVDQEKPVLAGR